MNKTIKSRAGTVLGLLTVTASYEVRGEKPNRRVYWRASCSCGNFVWLRADHIHRKAVQSCGCLKPQLCADANILHGHARKGRVSATFRIWQDMRKRCKNPSHISYSNYGGRGIAVCERWGEYANFLADMGERPEGLSLDRIDGDGNYEPANCRWADNKLQSWNTRTSLRLTLDGKIASRAEVMDGAKLTRDQFERVKGVRHFKSAAQTP